MKIAYMSATGDNGKVAEKGQHWASGIRSSALENGILRAGDTFVKADGTKVTLKVGTGGVLGAGQGCDLFGGMVYPDGSTVKNGDLGIADWGIWVQYT